MRKECIDAVEAAIGRRLKTDEAKGIENRIMRNMAQAKKTDPAGFMAKPPSERLYAAADGAAAELIGDVVKKQQRLALTILAHDRVQTHLADMAASGISGLDALQRMIAFHSDTKGNFQSVETQARTIEADGLRQMVDLLEASNPKFFGLLENAEGVRAITREIFGEDSGVAEARKGAEQWKAVTSALRDRFNRNGGDVGALDDWGLPHHHSQTNVARAGREQWVADTLPKLNYEKYLDENGNRMSEEQVSEFLGHAWETIATGGANKPDPGRPAIGGMRANRGNETRQIHFKDADSYIEYQSKYGESSLYEVLTGHISGISKDIALVETFGPNADLAYRFFREKSVQEASVAQPTHLGKIKQAAVKTDGLYNIVAGRNLPVASERLAKSFDTLRSWLISSRLGSAVVTSMSDEATLHMTARLNNLPHMRILANELATLNPANQMEKRMAIRAGLSMNTLISSLNRFGQEGLGASFSSKMANSVMRASGLNALTNARKRAFGVTMFSSLGQIAREYESLASLDVHDHRLLLSKGITDVDFAVWKKSGLEDWGDGNNTMLTPESVYRISDADIDAVIANQHQGIRDAATAEIEALRDRSRQDAGRVAARIADLAEAKTKSDGDINAAALRKLFKVEELHDVVQPKIDMLSAKAEQAGVKAKIELEYNKLFTQVDIDSFTRGLRDASGDLEAANKVAISAAEKSGRTFGMRRQALEQRMRDAQAKAAEGSDAQAETQVTRMAEQQFELERAKLENDIEIAFKATPEAERAGFTAAMDGAATVQASAKAGINAAERAGRALGREEARIAAQIRELEAKVSDAAKEAENAFSQKSAEAFARIEKREQDLNEYIDAVDQRNARREAVASRIERDIDTSMEGARKKAREQAATKLLGIVLEETDMAVIEPGARERAITTGGLQRGTWKGELTRSFFLFKSFPLAMIARHWMRGMDMETAGGKAAYIGSLVAATTVLGAVSMQLNEVLSGRDPRNLNPAAKGGVRNWIGAMLKGGSLGIYGDFLFSESTQHGQSPIASIMGPVAGLGESAFNLTQGNIVQLALDKKTHAGAELVKFVKGNTPGASMWYAKAALDRIIFHQLQEYFSPGYLATMRARSRREFDQQYWWEPGHVAPERAPDLSAVAGNKR